LTDCDQGLSEKIITLEHRINALSSQLDSQKDSQKIDTDSQKNDDMEYLLKREREASIATSPLPPSPPGTDAIASIDGTVTGAIETAIKPTIGDEPAIEVPSAKRKGLTDSELARHLGIDKSNITRWKQKGEPTQKYRDKWELRGRFWYEKN
jgi:hypothetical protein